MYDSSYFNLGTHIRFWNVYHSAILGNVHPQWATYLYNEKKDVLVTWDPTKSKTLFSFSLYFIILFNFILHKLYHSVISELWPPATICQWVRCEGKVRQLVKISQFFTTPHKQSLWYITLQPSLTGLGYVTCLGQWHVNRCDMSKGLK